MSEPKMGIHIDDVNKWLKTFDADDASGVLTDILNNQIKIEEFADSVLLHALDFIKEANICRENMYRSKKSI
jgi:hypothetical protein|tara:strand:- start:38 stop:253 length:216 start_codon:yes stop_codon:yes gene_type:complete